MNKKNWNKKIIRIYCFVSEILIKTKISNFRLKISCQKSSCIILPPTTFNVGFQCSRGPLHPFRCDPEWGQPYPHLYKRPCDGVWIPPNPTYWLEIWYNRQSTTTLTNSASKPPWLFTTALWIDPLGGFGGVISCVSGGLALINLHWNKTQHSVRNFADF